VGQGRIAITCGWRAGGLARARFRSGDGRGWLQGSAQGVVWLQDMRKRVRRLLRTRLPFISLWAFSPHTKTLALAPVQHPLLVSIPLTVSSRSLSHPPNSPLPPTTVVVKSTETATVTQIDVKNDFFHLLVSRSAYLDSLVTPGLYSTVLSLPRTICGRRRQLSAVRNPVL
jgi:hypothetical protein